MMLDATFRGQVYIGVGFVRCAVWVAQQQEVTPYLPSLFFRSLPVLAFVASPPFDLLSSFQARSRAYT